MVTKKVSVNESVTHVLEDMGILLEGSRSLKRDMRRKQALAKNMVRNDPHSDLSPKQIARHHSTAFHDAQRMNREGEKKHEYDDAAELDTEWGTDEHKERMQQLRQRKPVRVYHMVSPHRTHSLEDSLEFLLGFDSRNNDHEPLDTEISVSVRKGVWNVEESVMLTGLARLSSYYPTDVFTQADTKTGLKYATEPTRGEDSHHWDEATVRLSDIVWDKGYIGEGVWENHSAKAIEGIFEKYDIPIARTPSEFGSAMSNTAADERDVKDALEEYYSKVQDLISMSQFFEPNEENEAEWEELADKTPDDFGMWEIELFGVQDKLGEIEKHTAEVEDLIDRWEALKS